MVHIDKSFDFADLDKLISKQESRYKKVVNRLEEREQEREEVDYKAYFFSGEQIPKQSKSDFVLAR